MLTMSRWAGIHLPKLFLAISGTFSNEGGFEISSGIGYNTIIIYATSS
jgi:hypothetical protein